MELILLAEKRLSHEDEWNLFSATLTDLRECDSKQAYADHTENHTRECYLEINDDVIVLDSVDHSVESIAYVEKFKKKKGRVIKIREIKNSTDTKFLFNVYVRFSNDVEGIFYDTELGVI